MAKHSPEKTAARIASLAPFTPDLAMVLGSGFQGVGESLDVAVAIPYSDLPGFSPLRVDGHSGRLLIGHLRGVPILALCGRAHYYEGYELDQVTFPIRVLAALGVRNLVLTNAAGGINRRFRPGDFMRITDHINWMGVNPLRGWLKRGKDCFVDLSRVYDPWLAECLERSARETGIRLNAGVYLAVAGPCYETPAEIRAFKTLGADAVGMSTVPEAIVARHCRIAVAGLSCITNLAAGRSKGPLRHAEVLRVGCEARERAVELLARFAALLRSGRSTPEPDLGAKASSRRAALSGQSEIGQEFGKS